MRWIGLEAKKRGCVSIHLDAYYQYAELLDFYEKLGYQRKGTIWWKDLGAVGFEKVIEEEQPNA